MSTPRTPAPRQILDNTLMRLIQPAAGGMTKAQEYLNQMNERGLRLTLLGTNLAIFEEMPSAPAVEAPKARALLEESEPTSP